METDKIKKKLIGKLKVMIDVSCGPIGDKSATSSKTLAKYSKFGVLDLNCRFTFMQSANEHPFLDVTKRW